MNLKTVLGWAAVAFLVCFAIMQPPAVAGVIHHVGNFLASI